MKNHVNMKAVLATIVALLIIAPMGVSAAEIGLNGEAVDFNEFLIVESGVTYIPLRVAFTSNSSDESANYLIQIVPRISENCVDVGVRRRDEAGNLVDVGKGVSIEWDLQTDNDDWKNGRLCYIDYTVDSINDRNVATGVRYIGLSNHPKLVFLNENGDRLFLSVSDLEKIAAFLTNGTYYQVDLSL